jgi:GNAT superfamily N-acetyltransferase
MLPVSAADQIGYRMAHKLEFVTELPDPAAFEALMREFYTVMVGKLAAAGGPNPSPADLAARTMSQLDELLPPIGRLLLATGDAGTLTGCGVLRLIRPDAAELKRMYVRPEARGQGLGRRLFEMRIAEARAMGCTTLYADTIRGNSAMLTMYERYGFEYTARYPGNANGPELHPYLVYLEHRLS